MPRTLPASFCALLLTVASCLLHSSAAQAQEFRIYTRLYDHTMTTAAGEPLDSPPVASRSLTLFHAGKAYDWIAEIGEVIIFDPGHRRFVVLNTSRKIATQVEFEELRQMLKVATEVAADRVAELRKQGSAPSEAAAAIEFQLAPEFTEQFDEQRNELALTSGFLQYRVQCADSPDPSVIKACLDYADWMSRLNYVLHPQTLLPGPRQMLNQSLVQRQLLPTTVELRTSFEPQLHFRAEHTIHWKLDSSDRSLIHLWESRLRSEEVRQVSIREYQRLMFESAGTR